MYCILDTESNIEFIANLCVCMHAGLSDEEGRALLIQSVNIQENELPEHADKIIKYCRLLV